MAPVRTLFLDAGGVLVFPNWERVAAVLERHGIHVPAATLRAVEPRIRFALDTESHVSATTDAQRGGAYFDGILDAAGVARTPTREAALAEVYAYHSNRNLWEHVPDDVPPALERLRALGLTLAVVSNANGRVQQALTRTGLAGYFDAICDSCIEGVEKPDPRFFQIVLARTSSEPGTTVHVGDLFHVDIVGARGAGLRAILLDPHGLYGGFDVERVRTLGEVATLVASQLSA